MLALTGVLGACSAGQDETVLVFSDLDGPVGVEPFLGFPETAEERADSPALLSQTLAFADAAELEPAPGLLPYSVQSPLWSDGAVKRRWLALPAGGQVGYAEDGPWTFPEGSVLIKHFGMVLDERSPNDVRRLETRFLVAARGGGYYGLVYKWDEAQQDAQLLLDGAEETLDIIQADGSVRQQLYTYPSQRACGTCHSEAAGYVMGPRTAQLNGDSDYDAPPPEDEASALGRDRAPLAARNQLMTWARLGVIDASIGSRPLSEHQRLFPLEDESASLEARVRSYWDSNCSACHNDRSPIPSWDARFSTPLEDQGVLLADPYTGQRADDARLIVPGEPERSLIYLRSVSTEPGVRMPPVLRNRVDEQYVALLRQWIVSLAEN